MTSESELLSSQSAAAKAAKRARGLRTTKGGGGAAFMATADGRLRNRAGVVLVSRGPGLANALVAVH